MNSFTNTTMIGFGTYGTVFKVKLREDLVKGGNEYRALKQIKFEGTHGHGFPITSIREINILKKANHPNIVKLEDIIIEKGSSGSLKDLKMHLVFEHVPHDLMGLSIQEQHFTLPKLKCLLRQMLQGLEYMHGLGIIHRDIKGSNILLGNDGILKFCDFGLARLIEVNQFFLTPKVVTRWYRAPELYLGDENYDEKVDVWSVGCVFVELLTGKVIFQGESEEDTLKLIIARCPFPRPKDWPGLEKLALYRRFANLIEVTEKR